MKRKLLTGGLLGLVLLTVTACGGGYQAPRPATTPSPTPAGSAEVTVTAQYGAFQPPRITITKGKVYRFRLESQDTNHTFTLDELGLNIALPRGQTVIREIKIDKAGTFIFYCSVPGHRQAGTEGTLEVSE